MILGREQFYIDSLLPQFNILKVAGSSLGYKHTEETLALLSLTMSGENHPMFGKTHSADTKALMSKAHLGKTHSTETSAKMSLAQRSIDRTGENNPRGFLNKSHTPEAKALISLAKYKKIFVYSFDPESKDLVLYKSFNSCIEIAKYFDCSTRSISNYLDKNKLYKKQWILSTSSLIEKE